MEKIRGKVENYHCLYFSSSTSLTANSVCVCVCGKERGLVSQSTHNKCEVASLLRFYATGLNMCNDYLNLSIASSCHLFKHDVINRCYWECQSRTRMYNSFIAINKLR